MITWSVKRIANSERITTDPSDPDRWSPVTDALVLLSVPCGYNMITERNLASVQKRVALLQSAKGPMIRMKGNVSIYITDADVAEHVGLITNATPMTDALFLNKLFSSTIQVPGADKSARQRLEELAVTNPNRSIEQ